MKTATKAQEAGNDLDYAIELIERLVESGIGGDYNYETWESASHDASEFIEKFKNKKRIYFESCGNLITASDGNNVVIRCASSKTDLRDDESIDQFIARHNGIDGTIKYLKQCQGK